MVTPMDNNNSGGADVGRIPNGWQLVRVSRVRLAVARWVQAGGADVDAMPADVLASIVDGVLADNLTGVGGLRLTPLPS